MSNLLQLPITKKIYFPTRHIWRGIKALRPKEKRMSQKYWQLRAFLEESQWWDAGRIAAYQLQSFQEIVAHAYENVPGYHMLYREAGIKPRDINSLADAQNLPFISREMIQGNIEDFTARNIPSRKRFYYTTSGWTGIPLGFYQTHASTDLEKAFIHAGWQRAGWQLSDSLATLHFKFLGSDHLFWDYNQAAKNLHISGFYLNNDTYPQYMAKIEQYRPKNLLAYPSTVSKLADMIIEKVDVGRINFDLILLGSESIYQWQIDRLKVAFPGSRLFGWYGHCEQAVLAPWCEHEATYHVWPFYGLTEVFNDQDKAAAPGEIGEIVSTSFISQATPFIRYRTKDLALRGQNHCPSCDRNFLILEQVLGRRGESYITRDGQEIPRTILGLNTIFLASGTFDHIRQYQYYQDTPGQLIMRIIPKPTFSDHQIEFIKKTIKSRLGEETLVEVEMVSEIDLSRRGKQKYFDQKLNLSANHQHE